MLQINIYGFPDSMSLNMAVLPISMSMLVIKITYPPLLWKCV